MKLFIAFDLSLTHTGVAATNESGGILCVTLTNKLTGMERIRWITDEVCRLANGRTVAFEGLSFGSRGGKMDEISGLAYCIRLGLHRRGQPFLLVPPSTLKKFVTGKGNADKAIVVRDVYKRWGVECADNNQADAVGLLQLLRCYHDDMEPETAAQREVLEKLKAAISKEVA